MARLYDSHGSHGSLARMARWLALYPNSASVTGTRERAAKPLGAEERSFPRPLARALALLAQMGELVIARRLRKPGDEVELFWLFEQNGGTVGRTLYSFHVEILSKNI